MKRMFFPRRSHIIGLPLVIGLLFPCATKAALATEQGTLIHFPAKLSDDWAPTEAAVKDAAQMLGKGAWLRFDNLWHEQNWEPFAPVGHARMAKIVGICQRAGFKPLMDIIPHPWPGSEWAAPWAPPRGWGDPDPRMFPWIARRYTETIAAYREILKANGIAEKDAAVQFGNEPAAGHPGGNENLPQGTWSGAALWQECNRAAQYGNLNVIAPAFSMQDHPAEVATREQTSALIDAQQWTAPVTSWALHNRVFHPDLSGEGYAQEYTRQLEARAHLVAGLAWPQGDKGHAASRAGGVWVTEGYVAVGDAGGDRAQAVKAVAERIKQGVPGVAVFIWYRWFPAAPAGEVQWQFDPASKAALGEVAKARLG